jgi:ATP-dependent DNA helicase 2 subunit 1
VKKGKIGLVRALMRRNASPSFCALLPQLGEYEDEGWAEPSGFHLIPLPFADDIRPAPIEEGFQGGSTILYPLNNSSPSMGRTSSRERAC